MAARGRTHNAIFYEHAKSLAHAKHVFNASRILLLLDGKVCTCSTSQAWIYYAGAFLYLTELVFVNELHEAPPC
jgi:hypothetical protein